MKRSVSIAALALLGICNRVFAETPGQPQGGTGAPQGGTGGLSVPGLRDLDPLKGKSFQNVVTAIANGLVIIAVPIAGIMVLVGAFQIMTAGGNTEKVESGKKAIWYAVIGFAAVLLADSVVLIIRDLITR